MAHGWNDFHRHGRSPQPSELERLAAEGARKHAAIADRNARLAARASSRNLAVAIGGYHSTPLLVVLKYVHYLAIATLLVSIGLAIGTDLALDLRPVMGTAALSSFLLIFARVFIPPVATKGQCEAEQAWVRSLPFALNGYFEVLAGTPSFYRTLTITIAWAPGSPVPSPATMVGAVRAVDPNATTPPSAAADGATFRWRTGQISGDTNIRVSGGSGTRYVYRNHRIVKYVHDLVEKVLLPAHRGGPIASVTIVG